MGNVKLICLIIASILIGCSNDSDICNKYLKNNYRDANLKHETLFKKGKLKQAIAIVDDIIKYDSNNYVAIGYLGVYKYNLCKDTVCSTEQLKEVYDLYKKSINLCNDYRIGYFNIIEILSEMTKTKYENDTEIVNYLKYYDSKWEKKANLISKGGQAFFRLGKIDESLDYLNEAIELDSNEAMAHIFKGKCFISRNELAKAMESLNHGLSLDSLSLGFHERGYVNRELGNIDKAIQDLHTSILLYDERWESYIVLGQIEIDRNNIGLACQYFSKAEELMENSEIIEYLLLKYCKK